MSDADDNVPQSQEEVKVFIDAVVSSLPASAQWLQMYRKSQAEDSECAWVQEYLQQTVGPALESTLATRYNKQ